MKDKEKQIEEICNLLFCDKWEQPFTDCHEDIKCIECIAKQIYNAGYRKIDKDSVVLSREEYKRLLDNAIRVDMEYLEHQLAQARKETASEILQWLKQHCDYVGFSIIEIYFKEQFGVEIKE